MDTRIIEGKVLINHGYGRFSNDSAQYDLFYIKHLSFMFDLTILLETVKVVLTGKGGK